MVEQNALWTPLNMLWSKQSGWEKNRRNSKYIFPFVANNSKWYRENGMYPAELIMGRNLRTTLESLRLPKQQQRQDASLNKTKAFSVDRPVFARKYRPGQSYTEKKDCLSMTWKLVNNSGHNTENNYGLDTLKTTWLTTCQWIFRPFDRRDEMVSSLARQRTSKCISQWKVKSVFHNDY